jgi:hypothetical protein
MIIKVPVNVVEIPRLEADSVVEAFPRGRKPWQLPREV